MKKAAFIASVTGHIRAFHLPYLEYFKSKGYKTCVIAGNDGELDYCDKKVQIPIDRFPFKLKNFKAFIKLKRIFKEEQFDIIHCHTPVVSMLTRIAAICSRGKGTNVIYTAHGFHFYKGAPLLNWLIYFPIEWFCSFFTDALITINKEDYNISKKFLKSKRVYYAHGVGFNLGKVTDVQKSKEEMKSELCIPQNSLVLLSVGELNKNKNHETIIKAISEMDNTDIYYIIAGNGSNVNYLSNLACELGLADRVKLLGFRTDIADLLNCSDIFCFPSIREGLPVSVMEAMAVGLPVVASKIRGVSDLISDGKGGYLCTPLNHYEFKEKIEKVISNKEELIGFSEYNKEKIKEFSIEKVLAEMSKIYEEIENDL